MQATLAQVDELGQSDHPDMLRITAWDRQPDPQLFVANCSKVVTPEALLAAIGAWLKAAGAE
eukprot:957987-Pyramimonas_sp.AAC.1